MSKSWLRHGYNKVSRIVGRSDKEESTSRCWKATLWAKHMQNKLLRPMAPSKATSKDS